MELGIVTRKVQQCLRFKRRECAVPEQRPCSLAAKRLRNAESCASHTNPLSAHSAVQHMFAHFVG